MIRRLAAWLAPEQPAEPSWLDVADRPVRRPMGANCCGRPPVATVHGWTLCETHNRKAA